MSLILWSDSHFTDNPRDAYRWDIFDFLIKTVPTCGHLDGIVCLGDLVDRKDRHSALLVNKLCLNMRQLMELADCPILILAGNHDAPLTPPYYWEFLNDLGIKYMTEPEVINNMLFLPFSPNPVRDWAELNLASFKLIFMHQTVAGAKVEGDRVITSNPHPMPKLPTSVPIFSGDVHRPQDTEGITYVGAPHPVRFGENFNHRIMVISDDLKSVKSIPTNSIKRSILNIASVGELKGYSFSTGDQVRIRYSLTADQLSDWPQAQQEIKEWAMSNEIELISITAEVTGDRLGSTVAQDQLEIMKPGDVIRKYGTDEKLDDFTVEMGVTIAEKANG